MHRRILVAAAALVLVYTVAGFLVFPALLRSVAARQMTRFLGRTVTIRAVTFNPYTLSTTVRGFQIDDSAGGTFFSLDSLHATLAPLAMLSKRIWAFRDISLDAPRIVVTRDANGAFSLADLFLLDWPKDLHLQADLIRVVGGQVHFHDASVPGGFSTTISDVTVTVNGFSTGPDQMGTFAVKAVSEEGGKFSSRGSFRVHPLSAQGEIAAEDVPLRRYSPYLEKQFAVAITGGDLAAQASFTMDLDRARPILLLHDGTITSRSVTVTEQERSAPLFGFTHFALSGVRVDLAAQSVAADSIVITGGSASLRRLADGSFNLQHLARTNLVPSAVDSAHAPAWSAAVGEIRLDGFDVQASGIIGRETLESGEILVSKAAFHTNPLSASLSDFVLRDGTFVFRDPSVSPAVTLALTGLHVQVGGLSSADPRKASVTVDAAINGGGHLQIFGDTNPTGTPGETSLRGLIRNFDVVPLSPYAAKYLGYELAAGDLGLDVSFLLRGRTISAHNQVQIDQLELGPRTESKDATKLPVRLAIFLLKDSSGRITLRVPLEMTLDNSRFEFQKTIVDTLLRPFRETAKFPFSVLSASTGGDGEALAVQAFSPGSAELAPRETGKLDTILQGLALWPELMLDVVGSVDAAKDTGDLPLLADQRAIAVREYLLRDGALDPDRVFLITNAPEQVDKEGSRVLLSLRDRYRGAK